MSSTPNSSRRVRRRPRLLAVLLTFAFLCLSALPALAATGTITGSVVNIRGGPGTSYTKVGAITKGANVEVIKQSGGWCQIRYNGNKTGWVSGSLISVKSGVASGITKPAPTPAPSTAGTVEVTGKVVNLRQGPGTSYPVVGKVTQGTALSVLASQNGWYQVTGQGVPRSYITSGLVKVKATVPAAPAQPAPPAANPTPDSGNDGPRTGTVTGKTVNLRSGPGTSYARIGQVVQGQVLTVYRTASGWHLVKTADGKEGWISAEYVQCKAAAAPAPVQPQPPAPVNPTPVPEPPVPPSRGDVDRDVDPDIEPPPPEPPQEVREGNLLDVSEMVAGDIQIITIKTSVPVVYETEKSQSGYVLTLKGMHKASVSSRISLAGRGSSQIEVVEENDPQATTLKFDAFGNCVYGVVPSDKDFTYTLKVFIKTDLTKPASGPATVVLDAGHGGRDPGSIGPSGVYEKSINLPVALEVGRLLEQQDIRVVYTRTDDSYVSLPDRSNIANTAGADLFVSVHCNGSTDRSKEGTSTYFYAPASNPVLAAQYEQRKQLATLLQNALLQELGRVDKGVRQDNFAVLRETTIPAALVETMFLTNAIEEQILCQADTQTRAASAIARGIKEYLSHAGRM